MRSTQSSSPAIRSGRLLLVSLQVVLAATLAACGGGGGGSADVITFYLADTTPRDGHVNVPTNQIISLVFNKDVDPLTVTPSSLSIVANDAGAIQGTLTQSQTRPRELRWVPSELMVAGERHFCTVSSGLRSVDGEALSGATQFEFHTIGGSTGPPIPDPTRLRRTIGSMNEGRQSHRATLLTDGRVLVTGGFDSGSHATDTAELYLPFNDTFINTSNEMLTERASHASVRLANGHVLICGGFRQQSGSTLTALATAEVYNPASNTFAPVGDMAVERANHTATLLDDGRVLIAGGSTYVSGSLTDHITAEIYDPGTSTFALLSEDMLHTRSSHVALKRSDGDVALFGGSQGDLRVGVFDPTTDSFTSLGIPPSASAQFGAAAALFPSGGISVAGGSVRGDVFHLRDGETFVFNTGSPLWRARSYATSSVIAPDTLMVVGGIDFSRGGLIESSVDIIVEGGVGGSRTYATSMRFPTGMAAHTATKLANGDVLFCGGLDPAGVASYNAAYIYEVPTE